MNRKTDLHDDQRVIADMNIEGTPWYIKDKDKTRDQGVFIGDKGEIKGKELFRLMSYAVFAGLSVAMVFIIAFFLFILFALNIWFN